MQGHHLRKPSPNHFSKANLLYLFISLYQPRRLQEIPRTHHRSHRIRFTRDIIIIIPYPLFWLSIIPISVQLHRHRRQGNDPCSGLPSQLRQHSAIARTSGRRLLSNPNPRIPHPPIRQLHAHRSCRHRLLLSHRSTPFTVWISTPWCRILRWLRGWAERSRDSRCLTSWIERKRR